MVCGVASDSCVLAVTIADVYVLCEVWCSSRAAAFRPDEVEASLSSYCCSAVVSVMTDVDRLTSHADDGSCDVMCVSAELSVVLDLCAGSAVSVCNPGKEVVTIVGSDYVDVDVAAAADVDS